MNFFVSATGVLGTGLTFVQFISSLLLLILGTIVIKVTFNFDINKFLDGKQERYSSKIKNACLHFEFMPIENNSFQVRPFFVSPSGTTNWICQRCGLIRLHIDEAEQERTANYYLQNIKEYNKKNDRFHKLLKKSGQA